MVMKHWIQSALQALALDNKDKNSKNENKIHKERRTTNEEKLVQIEKPQLRIYEELGSDRSSPSFDAVIQVWNNGVKQKSTSGLSSKLHKLQKGNYGRDRSPENKPLRIISGNSARRSTSTSIPNPAPTKEPPHALAKQTLFTPTRASQEARRHSSINPEKKTIKVLNHKSASLSQLKEVPHSLPSTSTNPLFKHPSHFIPPRDAPIRRTSSKTSKRKSASSTSPLAQQNSTPPHPHHTTPFPQHQNTSNGRKRSNTLPQPDASLAFDYNPAILAYIDSGQLRQPLTLRRDTHAIDAIFVNDPNAPVKIILTTPEGERLDFTGPVSPSRSPETDQSENNVNDGGVLKVDEGLEKRFSSPSVLDSVQMELPDRTRLMPPTEEEARIKHNARRAKVKEAQDTRGLLVGLRSGNGEPLSPKLRNHLVDMVSGNEPPRSMSSKN